MNLERKMKGFLDIAIKDANEQNNRIYKEVSDAFDKACAEITREARQAAEKRYKAECLKSERIKNSEILKTSTESKKSLIQLREQLMDEMFQNVEQRLAEFTKSPEYAPFLADKIKKEAENPLLRNAKVSAVKLRPQDSHLSDYIKTETGFDTTASDEDFIGGFILFFNDNRAMHNCSFQEKLGEVKRNFNAWRL